MSRSIDERIVEMKFDNKQFEGGIKESLASLQRLEDALNKNISSKSIDDITEAASRFDVSGIAAGVDALNSKFSAFGIAGITIIQNLTNALINGLGRAIGTVTDSIVSGGLKRAQNIQTARFQLEGIIKDEAEVSKVMDNARDSVTDTAYSYDEAAKAASQFAASGLRSGEQMQNALKGISGVAATTSSDYEGIARIFTTVAGQGRLMGDQLLQLSSRGMNAAATLKDFFNAVSADPSKASAGVAEAIRDLTGATNTFKGSAEEYEESLESAYEATAKAYNNEYKLLQKSLNTEYKALQKALSKEYDAKKEAYDNEYNSLKESLDREYKERQKQFSKEYDDIKKSLDKEYEIRKETFDKEYEELQKSLDAEITAQQKANSERLKEADKAYQEDVKSFKKATEEKIALIDKEYSENLKLIDEEAYKKSKALEDQIDAIDKAAEAEEKERKLAERNSKLAELQNAVDSATSAEAREKAAKTLLEFQQKVAQEELAEQRKAQKTKLKEEIAAIKEEANVKKQAAKESRDAAVKSTNDEANAELEAMADKHEKEREQLQEQLQEELNVMKEARNQRLTDLRKSQNEELAALRESQNAELEAVKESQNAELEALRDSHNNQLSALRKAQNNELEVFKEGQNAQLEALKEKQNEQLEALKESNNAKLKALKKSNDEALKSFSSFSTGIGMTEADIREMVSKGLISFDMFAEAMSWAFGDHATEANKTFLGSLANVKAALARTGEAFFTPLIRDEGEFVQLFNVVKGKINDFNKEIGKSGGLVETVTTWINKVIAKLTTFVSKIDVSNGAVAHIIELVKRVFDEVTGIIDILGDKVEKVVSKGMIDPFRLLSDAIEILSGLFKGIWSVIKPVADALKEVFLTANLADGFYDFVDSVKELAKNFKLSEEQSEKLKKAFKGVFEFVKSILGVVEKLFNVITGKGASVGDILLSIISRIGDIFGRLANWINTSETLDKIITSLGSAVAYLLDIITSDKLKLWNNFITTIEQITGIDFSKITSSISKAATKIGEYIVSGFSNGININISDIVESAKQFAFSFIDKVKELFGIHSPSLWAEQIAEFLGLGFIKGITDILDSIKQSAIDFVSSFMEGVASETENVSGNFGKLSPIIDWIKNTFWPAITGNAGSLVSLAGSAGMIYVLVQLGKAFATIASSFGKIFGSAGNLMQSASSALNSVKDIAESYAKDVRADAFKKTAIGLSVGILALTASLYVLSTKTDPNKLIPAAFALMTVSYVFSVAVEKLLDALNNTKTVESALDKAAAGFSRGFKKLGEAVKIRAIGAAVKAFATAIGIIVVDIAAIMFLYHNYESDFNNALNIVATIAIAIIAAIGIMSVLGQATSKGMAGFAKACVGVLALSAAVLICITAIKDILALNYNEQTDQKKLELLQNVFIGVMALAGVVGLASRIAGKGGIKLGSLLGLCALIITSLYAIKKIFDFVLPFDYRQRLDILYGLFTALGLLFIAIGGAGRLAGGGLKATGEILAMCAFIGVVTAALVVLQLFPGENLKNAAISLGIVLVTLAAVLFAASKLVDANAGPTILGMAVMIATIVAAISFLSFIPWEKLIPSAVSLGIVLLTLAVVFNSVSKITNPNMWGVVVAMVAMLAGIIIGLKVLSSVESWETLIAAALSISAILLAISKCFKELNKSETPSLDHVCEFIVGVLAVAAIAQILRMLSDMSWETLLASAGAISGVLLAIAGAFRIINDTKEIEPDKMMAFIVGALVAGVIGLIMAMCADIPWETLIATAGSIAGLLIAMGVAFAIMNGTNFNLDSAGMMIAGCIAVGAIGMALAQAATQDWKSLLAAGVSISVVLLALAITMNIVAIAGAAAEAALIGIGLLDAFIADLALVLYGLSKLADADVLKDGAEKLGMIGKALGDFVGSIIEGIGEGVGRALEAIGTSLSNFMTNAQPFFDGLDQMDDSKVQAASALAGLVLALSAAEFLDGVNNLLGVFTGDKDMSSFGDKLVSFGESIKSFDEATVGVNAEHLKTVAEGAKYLIDIANAVPNEGGWLAKIVGENDIAEFGRKLASFGPSLAEFAKSTASIRDVSNWKTIAEGTLALIDMANQIPNTGGWLAKIVGDNDIAEFGKALLKYSIYMQSFNGYVAGIGDVTGWKNLADGTLSLINMAKQIPNSGGLASLVTGDNDIGKFGSSLNTYAYWMKSFNIYMQDITEERLVEISRGTITLINMCKQMAGIDQQQLSNFGKTLSDMAQNGLTSFINVFQTQTPIAISTVQTTIASLASSATRDVSVQTAFYQLAQRSMTQYMKGVTDNTQNVLNTIKTLLDKIVSSIKNRDREFTELGKNHVSLFLAPFKANEQVAENYGKFISGKVCDGIMSRDELITKIAKYLVECFVQEFKSEGESSGERAANDILDKIFDVFKDAYDDFKEVGENIGQGLRRGIEDAVDDVARAARDMAREARDAIEDELKIYSPSRVMREDGGYVGEGFALGIIDKIRRVKQAAIQMAQTPVDAVKTALDDIPELDPTITPIVDLTNVMDAAETINGMFSEALSSIGINVTKASTSMTARQQTNNPQNIQNDDGSGNTNVTFIQNNNSPKALSRIDIYRQTRNQLAQFREAVERT